MILQEFPCNDPSDGLKNAQARCSQAEKSTRAFVGIRLVWLPRRYAVEFRFLAVSRNVRRRYFEMPRLGRARRKTRPSRYGHSVGLLLSSLRLISPLMEMGESNARAIGSGA